MTAVDSTLEALASQPDSGAQTFMTKSALQGMRRFPVSDGFEKILLFYFPLRDGVDLVRVVHGSRDLERLFLEGFFG